MPHASRLGNYQSDTDWLLYEGGKIRVEQADSRHRALALHCMVEPARHLIISSLQSGICTGRSDGSSENSRRLHLLGAEMETPSQLSQSVSFIAI